MEARVIPLDETRRWSLVGIDIVVRVGARDSAGALSVLEQRIGAGRGSPLHTVRQDKILLVTRGQVWLELGSEQHRLEAGRAATIPAGTPHRFYNEQAEEACLLMWITPGGHELYLADLAELDARGALTPSELRRLSDEHGVALLEATA
jgi:quercetin dioxygenase-like cupin family protein